MSNPRDHAQHPHRVRPGDSTDSAGHTWHDRSLSPTGFERDTGQADPAMRAMLRRYADGTSDDLDLMAVVAEARFLIPIVAEPVAVEVNEAGLSMDPQVNMAAVTLRGPDGTVALPVFTGTDSLSRWRPQARPVPVSAARAAQAAVTERCDLIVIDPSGPVQCVLRASMVWALAQQRAWEPAHTDPVVEQAVAAATAREADVAAYRLSEGEPSGTLRITVSVQPGLDRADVEALATRIGERLATDGKIRARIDALSFAAAPA
ncbi:MAG: SseB family protein [Nostocoides sp.]